MLKKLIAAAAVAAACISPMVESVEARPPAPAPAYPSNSLKWQIRVLAPIGWKPFAYHNCQQATSAKIQWLIVRRYHLYVVERCTYTLDGYYRSTIRYWR